MKSKRYMIIILGVFLIFSLSFLVCKDKSPYPKGGKDTEAEFGDRRFVILQGYKRTAVNEKFIKYWILYDRKTIKTIDYKVKAYKDVKPYIYVIGQEGYTKVDYEEGKIIFQTDKKHSLSEEDSKIFDKLEEIKK